MADIDLLYGRPGSRKTTLIGQYAKWLYKTKGLKTRVYCGDGGVKTLNSLIRAGIVQAWDYTTHNNPQTVTRYIAQGAWPTGYDSRQADVPPSPTVELVMPGPKELAEIGCWAFEGIQSMGSYVMGSGKGGFAWLASKGKSIGMDKGVIRLADTKLTIDPEKATGQAAEMGETFGGNTPTHYGFAQSHLLDCIRLSKGLPGKILWTTWERVVEPKEDNKEGMQVIAKVYESVQGPAGPGAAMTSTLAGIFGNTLHLMGVKTQRKEKDPLLNREVLVPAVSYRMYLRNHFDPEGRSPIMFAANSRIPPTMAEKFFPQDWVEPDLIKFYATIEEAERLEMEEVLA